MLRINDRVTLFNIEKSDLHMHTVYCDGHNTPEEMIISAIEKGMECIGFSGHSFVKEDPSCGMDEESRQKYLDEVRKLREKYRDKITVWCGIEQDYLSETGTGEYDYVIGSVHYIDTPEGPCPVDDTPRLLKSAVEKYYGGDYYRAAENYFEQVGNVIGRTHADIVGHFDLFSKFNEKEKLFDEEDRRYKDSWKKALEKLLTSGKVFEINTGAMSRGYRSIPYPAPEMIEYIRDRGGRFVLSGDSHKAENIGFGFAEMKKNI